MLLLFIPIIRKWHTPAQVQYEACVCMAHKIGMVVMVLKCGKKKQRRTYKKTNVAHEPWNSYYLDPSKKTFPTHGPYHAASLIWRHRTERARQATVSHSRKGRTSPWRMNRSWKTEGVGERGSRKLTGVFQWREGKWMRGQMLSLSQQTCWCPTLLWAIWG